MTARAREGERRRQLGRGGQAILETRPRGPERAIRLPSDYAVPDVADKIVRIILSYTDYVRRTVWREP